MLLRCKKGKKRGEGERERETKQKNRKICARHWRWTASPWNRAHVYVQMNERVAPRFFCDICVLSTSTFSYSRFLLSCALAYCAQFHVATFYSQRTHQRKRTQSMLCSRSVARSCIISTWIQVLALARQSGCHCGLFQILFLFQTVATYSASCDNSSTRSRSSSYPRFRQHFHTSRLVGFFPFVRLGCRLKSKP